MSNNQSRRVAYFDLLNVVSCISVVILHCNGYIHSLDHTGAWGLRVFYETFFYFAVPIFFMLSGATLLGYRRKYDTRTYFLKRLRRTVMPFLIFSLLFCLVEICRDAVHGQTLPTVKVMIGWIMMTKVPNTVYWFFIPLFLMYLVFPFLSLAVERSSKKMMYYICGLLIFFQCIFPWLVSFTSLDLHLDLPIGSFIIYPLLGYAISHDYFRVDGKVLTVVVAMALLSLAYRCYLLNGATEHSDSCFSYMGVFAVFPSIAIFMLAKQNCKDFKLGGVLRKLSSLSLGVYLLHFFILRELASHVPFDEKSWYYTLVMAPIVYGITATVVWVLRRTLMTKWMLP